MLSEARKVLICPHHLKVEIIHKPMLVIFCSAEKEIDGIVSHGPDTTLAELYKKQINAHSQMELVTKIAEVCILTVTVFLM